VGTAVIVTAGYFLHRSYQTRNRENLVNKTYESRMVVAPTPGVLHLIPNLSLSRYFSYPKTIQNVLDDFGLYQSAEYLQWVPTLETVGGNERNYSSKNGRFLIKEDVRSSSLEITYKSDEPESGLVFLNNLFALGNKMLADHMRPLAEAYVDSYEKDLKKISLSNLRLQQFDVNFEYYVMTNTFLSEQISAMVQLFEPYTLELELAADMISYKKIAIVIMGTAILFSIFLIFFLNAIRNIKKDEDAMRRIREAFAKKKEKQ
jgi:hypothetical protein